MWVWRGLKSDFGGGARGNDLTVSSSTMPFSASASAAGDILLLLLAFAGYGAVVATRPDLLRDLLVDEVVDRIVTAGHGRIPYPRGGGGNAEGGPTEPPTSARLPF